MTAFACVCGEGDETALAQYGCFRVTDSQGRSWFCRQENPEDVIASSVEVAQLQQLLQKHGFRHEGTTTAVHDCDKSDLPKLLGER